MDGFVIQHSQEINGTFLHQLWLDPKLSHAVIPFCCRSLLEWRFNDDFDSSFFESAQKLKNVLPLLLKCGRGFNHLAEFKNT